MREPRAFAELEAKIEQEEKPVQKPVKKEPVSAGQKPDPKKSWELWDKNLSLLKGDDIEASNKAAEEFGAEFSKHLNPKQLDEFDTIIGTYKSPDEVEEYMTKVIGKRPAEKTKAPKQEDLDKAQTKIDADKGSYKVIPDFKFPFEQGYDEDYERSYGPGADADDIDQELTYSKDLYKGKSDDEVIATLSQRLNTHPEKIKKLWNERQATYKEAVAQVPRLEKVVAKAYPKGTDEYKTFDSQFLLDIIYDALPKPLGDDQLDKIEKEFAKYLSSKGYKDVSNNPIVEYDGGKNNLESKMN